MRTFDVPGLAAPVELAQIIVAGSLLIGLPLLGWLVQRLVSMALRRRRRFTIRPGSELVLRSVRGFTIAWFSFGGAFAAVAAVPLTGGVRRGVERSLFALLIIVTTAITARMGGDTIRLLARRTEGATHSSSIFVILTRIFVTVLGLLFLMQNLGISITPILTALGVGGLAVALALQDTLSNFFSGLQLLATKKVKPGDYIKLDTLEEGFVVDIDWRHTSIRMLPNNMVLVPNSKLANAIVTNYHYPVPETSILLEVGVAYGSDLSHVERVSIEVARETMREVPGGVSDFEPFIRYHTFNDFSIDFTMILRVRVITDQYLVRHEFVKRLHRRYAEEDIVIPFPIRTIDWPEASQVLAGKDREKTDGRLP